MEKNNWKIEFIRDLGRYSAKIYIEGELLKGLPENISFVYLRHAIRATTGIVIPHCKDLTFAKKGRKEYANIAG